ncbi:MAG: hypothetical protein VX460_08390, partial [Planctomycetota bacterium]|nr:hypothetical protein [Planctomycetota bacterium]
LAPGLAHLQSVGFGVVGDDGFVNFGEDGLVVAANPRLARLGASSNSLDELEFARQLVIVNNAELGSFGPSSFPRLRVVDGPLAIGETDKVTSIEVRSRHRGGGVRVSCVAPETCGR